MGDVANYEVTVKVVNETCDDLSELKLAGYENVSAINWLAYEANQPFTVEDEGDIVRLSFSSLDDAFRFRIKFDEAVLPRN